MSEPFSRFLHPFDVARHPSLEPEFERALLASWASDHSAVRDKPALRKPPGARRAVLVDDILAALRSLDRSSEQRAPGHDRRGRATPARTLSRRGRKRCIQGNRPRAHKFSMGKDSNMPLKLEGSCRCGEVRFSASSHAPVPFMRCYCSICRKTAGGGGYAINLHADKQTLTVEGPTTVFHAELEDGREGCELSMAERHFCAKCASALWVFSPEYPDLFHPFASAIDSDLPKPPSSVHMMLASKPSWVEPMIGPDDQCFGEYPEDTLEEWHRARRLWVD